MDSPGEILRLCRLCLVKDQVNIPIFEADGDSREIFLKISSCLPVKVSREDRLPKKICDGCSEKLNSFYEFWSSSANAEKTLLSWVGEEDVEEKKEPAVSKSLATLVKEESEPVDEPHAESIEESTKDEAEAPPAKRARRSAAVKAQINLAPDSEDDDLDMGEPLTKTEEESAESDGEDKDPSYTDMPGTSADDEQAGPSGMGKDGVEAPLELIYINVEERQAKSFTCYVCMEKFTLKETLTAHIKVHTKQTKPPSNQNPPLSDLKCTVCKKVFKFENALEMHTKQEHLKEFNYFCETCQLGFVLWSDFKFHRETKHEPPKPCQVCQKLFPSSRQLKLHKLEHHPTKTRRSMKPCPLCNESVGNLKRHHEHCHTDTKQYTCEICGKSFKQKPTLMLHLMVHQDDRRHMCEYCGHVFLTNNHLVVHTRTHTGDKPYQCEVCQDRFGTRGSLVNHFRVHSGEKPFVCEHCGDSFARKKYLVSHYKCIHS